MQRATILLLTYLFVNAATAQDNRPLRINGWGTFVDPKKDCKIAAQAGAVTIKVPGTYHDLHTQFGMDAPRLLQEVEGDFVVQARAQRFELPLPKSAVNPKNPYSYVSSGILIWQDERTFVRFQRAANGDNKKGDAAFCVAQSLVEGKTGAIGRVGLADTDTYLRVERKQGALKFLYGSDGKTWTVVSPKGLEPALRPRVHVGVFVINATNRDIVHSFREFQLTRR